MVVVGGQFGRSTTSVWSGAGDVWKRCQLGLWLLVSVGDLSLVELSGVADPSEAELETLYC